MSKVKHSTLRKTRNANAGRTASGYWHGYPIQAVRLADIKPYENNPRRNDAAVPAVVASIKAVGFINPIVIDADNTIINGHTRRLAALELKMERVPCIKPTDLTPEQVRLLRLADNKTSELSNWDYEVLDLELDALEKDFDMSDFGFPEHEDTTSNQVSNEEQTIEQHSLIIKCNDEQECEKLYDELTERGFECRISTL